MSLENHIASRVVTPRPDCMIWTGATDRGYGRVSVDGKVRRVHRVVWEMQHGAIPDDLTIDHLCRVRMCVNTEHMELVTQGDNSRRGAVARAREKAAKQEVAQRLSASRETSRPCTPIEAAELLMDRCIDVVADHWVWTGVVRNGHPVFQVGKERWSAHRLLWQINNGPLDRYTYLRRGCEMPLCCNPDHYDLPGAIARRTHCRRGHELTDDNVYHYPEHGIRTCRTCASIDARERNQRKKQAAKAA